MNQEEEVVVVSAVRSPFGKFGGALKDFTLPKLGGPVAAEAIRRAGISPEDVQEVATGVNLPGGDRSIARQLLIAAGIPTVRFADSADVQGPSRDEALAECRAGILGQAARQLLEYVNTVH